MTALAFEIVHDVCLEDANEREAALRERIVCQWNGSLPTIRIRLHELDCAALGPGVAISAAILGFNLLGDGLRDALDPRLDTSKS